LRNRFKHYPPSKEARPSIGNEFICVFRSERQSLGTEPLKKKKKERRESVKQGRNFK